jgi:hypothetical protein
MDDGSHWTARSDSYPRISARTCLPSSCHQALAPVCNPVQSRWEWYRVWQQLRSKGLKKRSSLDFLLSAKNANQCLCLFHLFMPGLEHGEFSQEPEPNIYFYIMLLRRSRLFGVFRNDSTTLGTPESAPNDFWRTWSHMFRNRVREQAQDTSTHDLTI